MNTHRDLPFSAPTSSQNPQTDPMTRPIAGDIHCAVPYHTNRAATGTFGTFLLGKEIAFWRDLDEVRIQVMDRKLAAQVRRWVGANRSVEYWSGDFTEVYSIKMTIPTARRRLTKLHRAFTQAYLSQAPRKSAQRGRPQSAVSGECSDPTTTTSKASSKGAE